MPQIPRFVGLSLGTRIPVGPAFAAPSFATLGSKGTVAGRTS
jgi:hypothetical protein